MQYQVAWPMSSLVITTPWPSIFIRNSSWLWLTSARLLITAPMACLFQVRKILTSCSSFIVCCLNDYTTNIRKIVDIKKCLRNYFVCCAFIHLSFPYTLTNSDIIRCSIASISSSLTLNIVSVIDLLDCIAS